MSLPGAFHTMWRLGNSLLPDPTEKPPITGLSLNSKGEKTEIASSEVAPGSSRVLCW